MAIIEACDSHAEKATNNWAHKKAKDFYRKAHGLPALRLRAAGVFTLHR
jgi:hypothetical protein